jgi:hypothetical protein
VRLAAARGYGKAGRMRFVVAIVLFLITANSFGLPTKVRELVTLGEAAREKQKNLTVSWKATIGPGDGEGIEIQMTQGPELKRIVFHVVREGQRHPFGELYIDKQFWYSRKGATKPAKYRPYEADFLLPSFYGLLPLAELRYADLTQLQEAASATETNGVVEVRVNKGPEFEAIKTQLQKAMALLRSDPAMLKNPKNKKIYDDYENVVLDGLKLEFDSHNGLLTKFLVKPGYYAELRDVDWSAAALTLPKENWIDRTAPLAGIGTDDVVMMGHALLPESRDLDTYALNIRTLDFRRVPSPSGVALPGCFLPGRKSVLVGASDLVNGGFRPRTVNLETGKSEEFLPEIFAGAQMVFGGTVSPDEKRMAMMLMKELVEMSRKQIVVIDLAGKTAEKIGEPDDYASIQWLANGRELLLDRIEPEKRMDAPLRKTVWIVNLKGEARKVANGRESRALHDGRILLEREDKKWVTVDANGKSEKRFGNNLPERVGFPAVSPDGKRVLFVQFGDKGSVGLVVVDADSGKTELGRLPNIGMWTTPVW